MPTLIYRDQPFEFEHIPNNRENYRKIRLIDEDGCGEGIWVVLSDEGLAKYKDDTSVGETIVCCLRNHSLIGIPWGAYVVAETRGPNRPEAMAMWHSGPVVLCPEATKPKEEETVH